MYVGPKPKAHYVQKKSYFNVCKMTFLFNKQKKKQKEFIKKYLMCFYINKSQCSNCSFKFSFIECVLNKKNNYYFCLKTNQQRKM